MWKPSVNAIWLRAAPSSDAMGMALSSTAPPRSSNGFDPRRRALDRRQLALHHIVAAHAEPGRHPVRKELDALALVAEVDKVHAQVGGEGGPPGQFRASDLADGATPADHGQRALVEVAERGRGARLAVADRLRDVRGLLDRDRGEARQGPAVRSREARDVADHGDLRVARHGEVR